MSANGVVGVILLIAGALAFLSAIFEPTPVSNAADCRVGDFNCTMRATERYNNESGSYYGRLGCGGVAAVVGLLLVVSDVAKQNQQAAVPYYPPPNPQPQWYQPPPPLHNPYNVLGAASPPASSMTERLTQAKQLLDSGLIDEEEFKRIKAEILGSK